MGNDIVIYLTVLLLLVFIIKFVYDVYINKTIQIKEKKLEEKSLEIEKKIADAEKYRQQTLAKADVEYKKMLQQYQKECERKQFKIDRIEESITKKEHRLDEKMELIEKDKEKIKEKIKEVENVIIDQKQKLSQIAQLNPDEARQEFFKLIEKEKKQEILNFINKFKAIKEEEAQKEGALIIAKVLPRVNIEEISEFTVSLVDIPNEDIKGKIIGREGRNIGYFEKVTGVELLIDDTPLMVKISSYDSEKRFIAVETLKKLIKDGRISPVYIEKIFKEISDNKNTILFDKGKEALSTLNLPMVHPDVIKMIGQFYLRFSYGQNLWIHSLEVARLSELIANELKLDSILAKKAGLLHDIGKVLITNGQAHTKIGADFLRKYSIDPVIINAAEGHHMDVPLTHPIAWIVATADAISASRPGARFNTKELFIERMTNLEKLIFSISGIDKVYIMQAGREIMVFVNPKEIDDLGLEKLIKEIGIRVEDQLEYPGVIRVIAIRESKVISYLR